MIPDCRAKSVKRTVSERRKRESESQSVSGRVREAPCLFQIISPNA